MNMSYKRKWLIQKISIVLFIALSISLFLLGKNINFFDYQSALNFVKLKTNAILIFLLILSIMIHFNIGISSIIDDYFHKSFKKKILILKNFLLVVLFGITILSLYLITN